MSIIRYRSVMPAVKFFVVQRQRLMALFFTLTMLVSVFVPVGQVYADAYQNRQDFKTRPDKEPNRDKIRHETADAKKPMKQNYAAGLSVATSKNKPASDYDAPSFNLGNGLLGKRLAGPSPTNVQGLQAPGTSAVKSLPTGELLDKRTRNSTTSRQSDGKLKIKQYMGSKFYQKDGKWEDIDVSLVEDKNSGDASNPLGRALGLAQSLVKPSDTYQVKGNDWVARFAPSGEAQAMVRVKKGSQQIGFSPVDAKSGVAPVVTTDDRGDQTVHYYDLWPGVNVEYQVTADTLKENIVLKDKNATNDFRFEIRGGGLERRTLQAIKNASYYDIVSEGDMKDAFSIAPFGVVLNTYGPEDTKGALKHSFENGMLNVSLDKAYLDKLPDNAYPLAIDPTVTDRRIIGTRAGGNYVSFKSDGFVCDSTVCNPYAGSVQDSAGIWRNWRGMMHANFDMVKGKQIDSAKWYLHQRLGLPVSGTTSHRTIQMHHASCFDYNCVAGFVGSVYMPTSGVIDATNFYRARQAANDWGAWVMLTGEENVPVTTYKNLDPGNGNPWVEGSYLELTVTDVVPAPTVTSPVDNQVYVDPQVSFRINGGLTNPASGAPLQYEFCVSTAPQCIGAVMVSGTQASPQWTIPDGILQDGVTYNVSARSYDPAVPVYSNYGTGKSFRIDSRTGKDSTQAYDTLGPVSVDLATGNMTTNAASHSSAALGGSMGISLDYNSPVKSRRGLIGRYWNVATNYPGGIPTSAPNLTRVDQMVDFNWSTGSPQNGVVNNDWTYAAWDGYFTAPTTGSYYFGASVDDVMAVKVNNQQVFANGCGSGICYGSAISLQAGQTVPINITHQEATGPSYARLFVKGAVPEQIVSSEWLQTGVRPVKQDSGLTGRYYKDPDGTKDFNGSNVSLMMQRTDPIVSFDWGGGPAVPGGPSDRFLVRWTGYVTVPASGTYEFGTDSDDGSRITVGSTQVLDKWVDQGVGQADWGTGYALTANQPVLITVDYYENGGGAATYLKVRSSGAGVGEQVLPSSWLSQGANILPEGWTMGIDPDGNLSYDRLKATPTSVILTDSTGSTHEYTAVNGTNSYKPPVNEDGKLTRNDNGTYTFEDMDGRTYVFKVDGTVESVTSPTDDLKPAALKYQYGESPSRLEQITDGTDASRWAKVFYYGDSNCPSVPTGFDQPTTGSAVLNKLCAVKTDDTRITKFYYLNDRLSRIEEPGNEITDYQYDTLGRVVAVRDVAANDAVAAGVRTNDATVLTELTYDDLGRVKSVKQPAATTGASRTEHTVAYSSTTLDLKRYNNGVNDHLTTYAHMATSGYNQEYVIGSVYTSQVSGTVQIYSCKVGNDTFTSTSATCEGQQVLGSLGYLYSSQPVDYRSLPLYRCTVTSAGQRFDSTTTNCEGQTVEVLLGYVLAPEAVQGTSEQHITGATEPNGFTRRVEYDKLLRTVKDTDIANLTDKTEWDIYKDLVYSTTDEAGLKSTTIYDDNDRPVSQYGPAPAAWFGTDRKPLTAYAGQVPRTDTAYDEGMTGLAVAYYGYSQAARSLSGAPKLHTTNLQGSAAANFSNTFTATPVTGQNDWGFRASGKMRFSATGQWNFRVQSDDGVRMYIDDVLQVDDWGNGPTRYHPVQSLSNTVANSVHKFKLEYYHAVDATSSDNANVTLCLTPPGGTEACSNIMQYFTPDYGLTTSSKVYDSTIGDVTTITNYGANPELGLAQSTTVDPTGLNLTTGMTYETQGASGSFLRQTSKTLPGGNTTTYAHYTANGTTSETRDNPCTTGVTEAYKQAGFVKLKAEPDPDGAGAQTGRTTETIYDDAGRVVATRFNNDGWTCTTYDIRGRVTATAIPTNNDSPARTVTNNYSVNGNPLIVSSSDAEGTITTESDLSGRVVKYTNGFDDETVNVYDTAGRLTSRTSPMGTESFTYDQYDRLVDQKLDNVTYATVTYDSYGRTAYVTYPQAGQQKVVIGRDSLQRLNNLTYTLGNGTTTLSDQVARSQNGDIISGTELGQAKSFTYDKAGRLTAATMAGHTYAYAYGTSSCTGAASNNNAFKNSNRTSDTVDGVTTNYCYDNADRLEWSSNKDIYSPLYNEHGDIIRLGSTWDGGQYVTQFYYDSAGRTKEVRQNWGAQATSYNRDAQDRITMRWVAQNGVNTSAQWYGYTGAGDTPDFARDINWNITEKYLTLPGNVLLTIRPQQSGNANKTYSLPNIHGDVMVTTDASGTSTGTFQYDPFGKLVGTTAPSNVGGGASFGWVGQHEKFTETTQVLQAVQMGARTYIPTMGRFTQVDPVEGGTANDYVYPPDPINDFDLTGTIGWKTVANIASIGSMIPGPIGMVSSGVAAASYAAAGDKKQAMIAAAGLATFGVGGAAIGGAKLFNTIKKSQSLQKVVLKTKWQLGHKMYNSKHLGVNSKLFGNARFGTSAGKLNNYGKIKIGWSHRGNQRLGYAVFRVGFKYKNQPRHINLAWGPKLWR